MEPFLQHIAKNLYNTYGENISQLCIVFPNRRASLYFKKYLSESIQKPLWAPHTTTINELMQDISGLTTADNMKLLFELYTIYKLTKKSEESFDDFYFWGEMMLNDFDDIDKYLVNPEDLFKNLKSLKSIQDQFQYLTEKQVEAIKQFWQSFDTERFSTHQEDFISVWNVLPDIYRLFKQRLSQLGIAYEGMVYKAVTDSIKGSDNISMPHEKYIFAGFNALNNCEKRLFQYLSNNKLADFYWDYDNSYIKNQHHEAGYFLRDNINWFKAPQAFTQSEIFNDFFKEKNIEIISVPSGIGQAKIISQKLGENNETISDSPDKTAVVLADEHLLVPVLQSIPDSIEQVNITMGYPVINTPVYSLIEHIIDLQKNAKADSKGNMLFYHKNVLAILNHTYIKGQYPNETKELLNFIQTNNKITLSTEDLGRNDAFKNIFSKAGNYSELSDYLLGILHGIYNSLKTGKQEKSIHTASLEKEYIYHIYLALNRVKDILQEQKIEIKTDTYIRLLQKIIRNLRIPFTGEPLSGLQVMGILETRLLDFENVYITSVNEGTFPKTEAALSFIPYNLRRGFGLPTIEHQDAIYAYYFYRLLQRAKNITLLYNSKTDGMQTGEMSRFLYQLQFESNHNITEKSLCYDIHMGQAKNITIEKTPEIIQKLGEFLSSGKGLKYLSPSALSNYLRCRLRFYFRYVAEIKEADELSEEVDAPLFGNILHKAMNILYKDFIGKRVDARSLEKISKNNEHISNALDQAFKDEYFKSENKVNYSGKNIIIREMIEKYIYQILDTDLKIAPFEIISLEDKYEMELPVNTNGAFEMVKLGGKIDRVDTLQNHNRIIDYKTGSDKLEFKNMEALFSDKKEDQNSAVFQTFLYSELYSQNTTPALPLTPGIYSARKLYDTGFDYRILHKENKAYIKDYDAIRQEYTQQLNQLVQEIFDPSAPFTQTQELKNCEYCPYRKICHR